MGQPVQLPLAHHRDVATDIRYLGRAFLKSGDLAGAKDAFQRALQIAEKVLPPEDPELAHYTGDLANVLFALQEFVDANRAVGRAVEIAEKTFGPERRVIRNGAGSQTL